MDIPGISSSSEFSDLAVYLRQNTADAKVSTQIMKKVLDSQQDQTQELLNLKKQSAVTGIGTRIDVRA